MSLPRTFVGFSSTDINCYRLMCAWKAHEHIDFNFCDCQLQDALNSEDESYIKRKCRERIDMAGTYIMLIGTDTRSKHKYVKWEAEVAIEQECRIIGVNLDKWRYMNEATCPPVINDIGAMFVPFSPQIIAYALEHHKAQECDNWHYKDHVYTKLGYTLKGTCAERPRLTPLSEIFRR
jgi:MTH538 TIR-like domain (DUF1863)